MDDPNIGLTVFLLKPDQVVAFEKKLLGPNQEIIPLSDPFEGNFLPFTAVGGEPRWVPAVRSIIQSPINTDMHSKSPSGMLVMKRPGGTFVITFGHAWMKLEDSWLERDFGRRVALNAISKGKVVEIKAEQVFAKFHLASERAPRASSVDEFGVDFDRDLVAVVEGEPLAQPSFGKTVRGGTSLRVNVPIAELESVLDHSFILFGSDAYKKDWPEIDNINPVKDDALITSLEDLLNVDLVRGQANTRMSMFTPAQRRDEAILADSYVYGRLSKSAPTTPYLTFDGWLSYLARKHSNPTVAEAKASPLHILDDSNKDVKSCSVFDCFGYEVSLGGRVYVLSSGVWYEVVSEFIARINDTIKKIPTPGLALPAWNQKDDEGEYNARCAKAGPFLNCDAKKIFYGGGMAQFEFCDLVHLQARMLFFAKIVSKSGGMSHLTEQVRRTAELLFSTDGAYRQKLIALFKKHHPKADVSWLKARPRHGDWNLCLVSLGKTAQKLPFFARCGLVKAYKDLVEHGHTVSFTKV